MSSVHPVQTTPRATTPLYAAGFVTAFGAHSIAAGAGAQSENIGLSLLNLGLLLAVYDLAEVFLKPVFGALSDRIGPKPVIVGGLLAFAVFSLLGFWAADPGLLFLTRLGQGAAAAAFSPAASATVARLADGKDTGRYFGRYGSWKSLGYVIGPLLGAGLIHFGGFALLFATLSVLGLVTAAWVAVSLPRFEAVPRTRYTIVDLVRQVTERGFLVPTMVLAASTGALGAAIGFLPALATRHGLDPIAGTAAVSLLAIASATTQPWVGKQRDVQGIRDAVGMKAGLLLIAAGIGAAAVAPSGITVFIAALLVGVGVGMTTPLAFAHLAESTPQERMGRTMGSAEVGRELGDAGGPLIVGSLATLAGLPLGLGALAVLIIAASRPRLSKNSPRSN
ncbi:MFS transporter (plasmid) [Arthrobacter sp. TES]|uniref:MFS transporter n=1 Tax=Paenarthrobacter ureafaciens TaxID=37931 RepID=UPI0004088F24|nr:MFS transporter [Paenarthrobacter ureafaciens]AOY73837.1 hypothetical protein ARZXY2_4338 [Arthrobacter sp. ZXY-2]ERI38045.2 MFS transporter [Arthrobacter sp. AK-YN10]QOI65751.1 MFS transporter [Arthrobacter sp. TES]GLU61132.1 putative multi-drug resistance efflux pump [Paenarthrobacter ureafaciens]GLU65401.1 putative multi-drug resistance efflux pump [Paenarthrobacter ureafaciens]